eukprot:TRINITY_DN76042_c0_g1_i1.p1 TRINITY_DN76042_c0_g1~~TRINITY_DN76042_c0_g1_i1.p1  ORF type:complete len:144 (-),score=21.18 TRINITY_DN76042_c0_g1_i1:73-504(-)
MAAFGLAARRLNGLFRIRSLASSFQMNSIPLRCSSSSGAGPLEDKAKEEDCPILRFQEVMRSAEENRMQSLRDASKNRFKDNVDERNHHYNRGLQGLDGPNALGIHLPYEAHQRYKRGSRGTWGLSKRGATRLKYGLKKLADP